MGKRVSQPFLLHQLGLGPAVPRSTLYKEDVLLGSGIGVAAMLKPQAGRCQPIPVPGMFFVVVPVGFFRYCRNALSLPWVGPALNSFSSEHAWTVRRKPSAPPSRRLFVSPPTWTGPKISLLSSAHGFSSTLPRIHDQKNLPLRGQGFSGPSAARIEIPRARDVTKSLH